MKGVLVFLCVLWSISIHSLSLVDVYNGNRNVTCDLTLKKCLPSFIIGGFQKSGTTALAAHLSDHPNIHFPSKKEVHYFDKTSRYNKGTEEYLKPLPSWIKKHPSAEGVPSNVIYAEATPFYLASRVSCQRIAKTLPDVRMVAIYRDPVERAYSEYQMKLRRIEEQQDFFVLVARHVKELHRCMLNNRNDMDSIKKCVPEALSSHPRWSKLKAAVKKILEEAEKRTKSCDDDSIEELCRNPWSLVMDTCFVKSTTKHSSSRPANSNYSGSSLASNLMVRGAASNSSVHIPIRRISGAFDIGSKYIVTSVGAVRSVLLPVVEAPPYPLLPPLKQTAPEVVEEYSFSGESCYQYAKESYESIRPLQEAFQGEIEAFQECGGDRLRQIASTPVENITREAFNDLMDTLDGVVDKCLTVRTGISTQYFYRSMYAVQLHHCFKYIPPERFLILSSESLRLSVQDTVASVLRFVGLEDSDRNITSAEDEVSSTVAKHFPAFEKNTGWKLRSEYQPMDETLRRYLTDFFVPYDKMFDYLLSSLR